MRVLFVYTALLLVPGAALGQGTIIEDLADLQGVSSPPVFRGGPPDRVDLSAKLPPPRSQGSTRTCTSWGAVYTAASLALRARGLGSTLTLSPSFAYNQVSRDQWCLTGTRISALLNVARDVGALPVDEFAFDGAWCGRLPTSAELERAKGFRINSWSSFDATDPNKVKEQLARGVAVIFAMRMTAKLRGLRDDKVFNDDDVPGEGHTMAAIGYDEPKKAFLVQNSWGRSWAAGGYGWFGYDFWRRNVHTGFVIE